MFPMFAFENKIFMISAVLYNCKNFTLELKILSRADQSLMIIFIICLLLIILSFGLLTESPKCKDVHYPLHASSAFLFVSF